MDQTADPFDLATRVVLAEAGADAEPLSMAAVANVIKNRVGNQSFGGDLNGVLTKKYAFEPMLHYGTGKNNDPARFDPGSSAYQQASNIVKAVFSGNAPDPTKGATHFVSPSGQSSLGREMPSWASGKPLAEIGGHQFFAPDGPMAMPGSNLAQQVTSPPAAAAQPPMQGAGAFGGQDSTALLRQLMGALQPQQAAPPRVGLLGQLLFGPQGLHGVINKALPNGLIGAIGGALSPDQAQAAPPPAPAMPQQPPAAPAPQPAPPPMAAAPNAAPAGGNPLDFLKSLFGG